MADTVEEIIKVEGMHCHGCEGRIEGVLEGEEGIDFVKASHKEGNIVVRYDPDMTRIERIKGLINLEEGYKVLEKKADYKQG